MLQLHVTGKTVTFSSQYFNACPNFYPVQHCNVHCKCFDHKNHGDWKLQGPCRKNLHYLWKRAVRIAGKPHDNYRTYNYHRVSPQFLQPFSIDSADFPCRSPAISSPCSFYGQNICSVCMTTGWDQNSCIYCKYYQCNRVHQAWLANTHLRFGV